MDIIPSMKTGKKKPFGHLTGGYITAMTDSTFTFVFTATVKRFSHQICGITKSATGF